MKTWSALSVLLFCSVAVAQGKYRPGQSPVNQNPADYTIKVHIASTHLRACAFPGRYGYCGEGLYVDASLDGKKVELFGAVDKKYVSLIVPGDYLARFEKEKPRAGGGAVLFQQYLVLLPDRVAWSCEITGFSE